MKNILILGYVWPEPASSAAGTRMLELVDFFLAQQARVTFASAAALSEHRYDLTARGVQEQHIALNCSSFDAFVMALQPDVVLFDRFFTEEQFGWRVEASCPHALRILDTEDLHCLRHARHKLLKASQQAFTHEQDRQSVAPVLANPAQLYDTMSHDDMAQREIAAIFRCDLSLMISTFEIDFLQHYFAVPEQLLFYCPFLDSGYRPALDSSFKPFAERQHFIAIGNFRHEPNWDAVLWLKHQLWPLLRRALPQAELHIYGAYPPPKATQLNKTSEGFLVKGWAEDVHDVMGNARVCLAPLRFGAGLKGKLMDAMRCGTPSVTTSIGAEAMCADLAWGGAIADTAHEFVRLAADLYTQERTWCAAQQQGAIILRRYFSNKNHQSLLLQRLQYLSANLDQERRLNFIGNMLRHHQHKSTHYMGQWIEAKNRKPV